MCGIAGILAGEPQRAKEVVDAMNAAQRHRGPDHSVVCQAGTVTLGNTRLAIQDPGLAGNQPFCAAHGRYVCVFNGEIYNHRELVVRFGLQVHSSCDGEVIPALWERMGPACLRELRGMWAIALVDTEDRTLYLARDPFGIKPLHYRRNAEGRLGFASEARTLGLLGPLNPDPVALATFLHMGAPASGASPFREVCALPPNTLARIDTSGDISLSDIIEGGPLLRPWDDGGRRATLGEALEESVRLHLGADVPTALLLSSGVDSTVLAAVAARMGRSLECLSVSGSGSEDEAEGARLTARHYGHGFQNVAPEIGEKEVAEFFSAMQRPTVDGLNTFVVCRAVAEAGYKVALSGLGGDEAVGGYSHFKLLRALPFLRLMDSVPSVVRDAALSLVGRTRGPKARELISTDGPRTPVALSHLQRRLLPARLSEALAGAEPSPASVPVVGGTDAAALIAAEVALYLQPVLLNDADAYSMASSVELRVPLVDPAVFAAVALSGRSSPGKKAFVRALGDPYLAELARRPKTGFTVPMASWAVSGPLTLYMQAASDPRAPVWSVLDRTVASEAGLLPLAPRERWSEAWAVAALNGWLESLEYDAKGL
ncbi:MAG: asparagine synthetase B family protein [Acidimicrobiales bacterium]